MTRPPVSPERQRVLAASAVIVARAGLHGEPVPVLREARQLLSDHPDCGMTEREISDHLPRVASESGVAVDPSR